MEHEDLIRSMHTEVEPEPEFVEKGIPVVGKKGGMITHEAVTAEESLSPEEEARRKVGIYGRAEHISGENVERATSAPTERVPCSGGD